MTTVFTAEAIAILQILEIIEFTDLNDFYIFSDSRSVLSSICNSKNFKNHNYLIQCIHDIYFRCIEKNKRINFIWIPSHKLIEGNERADQNAKYAAMNGILLEYDLPYTDLVGFFKEKCLRSNNIAISNMAHEQDKGIYYYNNFFSLSAKPWFYNFHLNRRAIVTLNRLRSGHSSLLASLYRIGIVDSSLCSCGLGQENIDHILWNCSKYKDARTEFFKIFRKNKIKVPTSSKECLSVTNYNVTLYFSNFLLQTNLNIKKKTKTE